MIVDINPQNFQSALIDASMKKPIVIYFHAPQMPECQAMTPQVEALVGPANPQVTLARVDMNDPQLQPLARPARPARPAGAGAVPSGPP